MTDKGVMWMSLPGECVSVWGAGHGDVSSALKAQRLTLFFWLRYMACEILVPGPGIEPASPASEAQSLSHRTDTEVPRDSLLMMMTALHKLYHI